MQCKSNDNISATKYKHVSSLVSHKTVKSRKMAMIKELPVEIYNAKNMINATKAPSTPATCRSNMSSNVRHVASTCRPATGNMSKQQATCSIRHSTCRTAPSTPATCRSNRQLVAFGVRHVERNWTCSICFDMSKGWKNRSTCCQKTATCRTATFDMSKQHSTCCFDMSNSTCCFDMLLVWTGLNENFFQTTIAIPISLAFPIHHSHFRSHSHEFSLSFPFPWVPWEFPYHAHLYFLVDHEKL